MPAICDNSTPATWPGALWLANETLPGWALAYCTSSLTVVNGSVVVLTSMKGKRPMRVMGAKSFTGS